MPDSQRSPGAYPKRTSSKPPSSQMSLHEQHREPARQNRSAPRPGQERPERAPHARSFLSSREAPAKRPILPYLQETVEEQQERTERLRALRQDFLSHAQTQVTPQKPRNVLLAGILTIVMLATCIVGTIAFFQLRPTLFAPSGQNTVLAFLDAMKQGDYARAYTNCASTVQEVNKTQARPLSQQEFIQQAKAADKVAGPISLYQQTGSTSINANTVQYTFSITRNHTTIPNITLGVTQGADGSWKINRIDMALINPPLPSSIWMPDDISSMQAQPFLAALNSQKQIGAFRPWQA